ncbi:T9SS type A sorting domain-containing protein [Polaribacter glomeratus]|uniref:Secretion system C-terminal sorting domain-containing protein n=1 Tax=Polaribacter glomeratus TaxID=102 RepID=A0A2S7WF92_9FLAO|nr:T9SS type A sorting domain-containing protein [Polaribacter glomeratus]PQJ76299.1 hypothetical protein BTO16_10280 [Polaribacter glomeratus]TXD65432.1 T9SS type A sorting domain-containing protein [Polaribacter glomeratus]
MKTILLSIIFVSTTFLLFAQQTIATAGGDIAASGSVSYTIGQMITTTSLGNNGSVTQGIQQSIELFTLVNPDLKTLTLQAIIYPNPTKDKIVLALTDHNLTALTYQIFDVGGRLIKKGNVEKENTEVAMKDFSVGVYFLKVNQNNKQLKVFKIIKN